MRKRKLDNRKLLRRIPRAEREEVAALIRNAIAEDHIVKLREAIEADPDGWSAGYHFGGGRDVRDLLRSYGFGEKWKNKVSVYLTSPDTVLDQVWAPFVELAMFGQTPPPRTEKVVRLSRAELRLRARRRAYAEAAKAKLRRDELREWTACA